MTTGLDAEQEVLTGHAGNAHTRQYDFMMHLHSNYIGPRTALDAGNTMSIHVLARAGGAVTRTDGTLIEQRDEMRNYRIVGRLPYLENTPNDVVSNPVVTTVGNAATGAVAGNLVSRVLSLFGIG